MNDIVAAHGGRCLCLHEAEQYMRPGKSTTAGDVMGVFCTTFVPRNTWLMQYRGDVYWDEEEAADVMSDRMFVVHGSNKKQEGRLPFFKAIDGRGPAAYIKPKARIVDCNCEFVEWHNGTDVEVWVATRKDIMPNTELFAHGGPDTQLLMSAPFHTEFQ